MTHDKPDSPDRDETAPTPAPRDGKPSPAGPHDRPDLTDAGKTPGAGSLPDPQGGEADAGTG